MTTNKQWKISGGLWHSTRASQYIQESEWTFIEVELVAQSPLLPGTLLFVVKATGLALSSIPLRPVGNCWAEKTFIWIIKSRARLLFVLGCWKQQFCLKQLVLTHSITESLFGVNLAPDSSSELSCGFWSCPALEPFCWGVVSAG